MTQDPRNRISDLYHAALERPPAERPAFLAAACGDDEALREEVESLLAYDAASAPFLEQPAAVALAAGIGSADVIHRQLGPYTIVAPLGAGGMGEVYRARDTKLGRDVAIKVLPPHFTADPERRARFAREARTLATLNHPHIGAIYGLEESDGLTALVLELVEGPTLAEGLAHGSFPIADALAVARQIAEALEAAHEKGIVHRDLKPANIVLQGTSGLNPGGLRAKVLDFGLAKILVRDPGAEAPSGVFTIEATGEGRLLGTPAYMSPEQARGLAVDKRTDIWAFGCVLFEMLSGRRAFDAGTITDTIARIVERDPDWTLLPAETPRNVRALLQRCLRKDPQQRLHDIADARIELDDLDPTRSPSPEVADVSVPVVVPPRRRARLLLTATAVLLAMGLFGLMGYSLWRRTDPAAAPYMEFTFQPPGHARVISRYFNFTLSPDGSHLAFVGSDQNRTMLWVRPLATNESRAVPGTEGAICAFWKPDNRQIGFLAEGKLKTIPLSGGAPLDVSDAQTGVLMAGGTWNRDDVIVFRSKPGALAKVSAKGGMTTAVTALEEGDLGHAWPHFLPDGHHFLYVAQRRDRDELRVGSLGSAPATRLGRTDSGAFYSSGHLLFLRGEQLVAHRFDASTRQLLGEALPLARAPVRFAPVGPATFSVSQTSVPVLAYHSGTIETRLTWRDRTGQPRATVGDVGSFHNLDMSRDGERVAVSAPAPDGRNLDIWLVDLNREGDRTRLTTDPALEFDPRWSRDGRQVAFTSNRNGSFSLFLRSTDRTGQDVLLVEAEPGAGISAPDWSPDGRYLLYSQRGDLWLRPMTGDGTPSKFRSSEFSESTGVFSPDGRWVAYRSDASGRHEIYVSPFPSGATEHKVSRDGGVAPRWNGNGSELYFLAPDGSLMVASITSAKPFSTTTPQRLFETDLMLTNNNPYVVTKDGQRFLMPVTVDPRNRFQITIAVNWTSKLPK